MRSFTLSRACTTHGDRVQFQGRLANAYRHRLPILAARPDAAVQSQVVADHRNPAHRLRTIADQGRTLDRRCDLAILDEVGLAGREHELAAGDINLATTEVGAVDTLFTEAMISCGSLSPARM